MVASHQRRRLLGAGLAVAGGLAGWPLRAQGELLPRSAARRVVIVGGGWGGLATAKRLRGEAPELEVVLVDPAATLWSLPTSHRWHFGLGAGAPLGVERRRAAEALGYRFVQARVSAVDRDARAVVTEQGRIGYDWLVLAPGVRHDYSGWFGAEAAPAREAASRYPAAMLAGAEQQAFRAQLDAFRGGEWLIAVPPLPYRCPPAPYERAVMLAWWMQSRKLPGRVTVIDPNPIVPAYAKVFAQVYPEQIRYLPDQRVREVDPFARRVSTEVEDIGFDQATLIPPQQAGDLVGQAGLAGRDAEGRPGGWADQDPLSFRSRADGRIFVIGDAIGRVSPLFGFYPKTGHMAARQGQIVAGVISAEARERPAPPALPEGICHVFTNLAPREMLRIDTRYRLRGDGWLVQTASQHFDPQPRDEDLLWARGMLAELGG